VADTILDDDTHTLRDGALQRFLRMRKWMFLTSAGRITALEVRFNNNSLPPSEKTQIQTELNTAKRAQWLSERRSRRLARRRAATIWTELALDWMRIGPTTILLFYATIAHTHFWPIPPLSSPALLSATQH
jgi:hypothetical protein